ncbi:MAG: hypothetical protein V1659_00250 [Candidatus Woesearchaeota archaeon]
MMDSILGWTTAFVGPYAIFSALSPMNRGVDLGVYAATIAARVYLSRKAFKGDDESVYWIPEILCSLPGVISGAALDEAGKAIAKAPNTIANGSRRLLNRENQTSA